MVQLKEPAERATTPRRRDVFEIVFDFFSSVKLGVCVLLTCALFFALSTIFWQEPEVIVKHVTWVKMSFEVILVFLSLNIFAVTLSRYPWNRLKIGMLVTHIGLVITFAGAFITTVRGRDGTVQLTEGEETDRYFNGKDVLLLKTPSATGRGLATYKDFPVTLIGWTRDTERDIELALEDGTTIRIDQFYQHFRSEKSWKEGPEDGTAHPIPVAWLKVEAGSREIRPFIYDQSLLGGENSPPPAIFGPVLVLYDREASEEKVSALMKKRAEVRNGTLVIRPAGAEPTRIDVKDGLGKPTDLPGGYRLTLEEYLPDMVVEMGEAGYKAVSRGEEPNHPAIRIRVTGPEGFDKNEVLVHLEQSPPAAPHIGLDDKFTFSYDFMERFTVAGIHRTGKNTATVVVSPPGVEGRRQDVRLNEKFEILPGFDMSLLGMFERPVEDLLVHNDAPGKNPAIHVVWRGLGSETSAWVPFGATAPLTLADSKSGEQSTYYFNYTQMQASLPFSFSLKDFRIRHYEGTDAAASFESLVSVNEKGKPQYDQLIKMNTPLKVDEGWFGTWKIFQNSYDPETADTDHATSTFSVSYDPGRPIVYTGFLAVCAGVFFMFWVKPFLRKSMPKAQQ